ncbi:MAG: hypothetical protein WCA34_04900 [Candidatus Acidiferrales bacterium]
MKTIRVVAMFCGLALSLGFVDAARAQQSSGAASAHAAGGAAGTAAMSADTPEDDATLNLTDEQKAQI